MERRDAFLRAYQTQVLDALTLPPALRARYRPQACLKDGVRQVYLLTDRTGQPVICKLQPDGRDDPLRTEYALLQQLEHPQLPRPLAYTVWQGREYLVREYVQGVSLAELVAAQGSLPPARTQEIARSLCTVLEALHGQQPPVICRDIKPQNVILDAAGCCHLIDLGAARRYCPAKANDTVCLGSRMTAPPEQFGYQQTDQRSDIYSLGMLMRYLLTGTLEPLPSDAAPRRLRHVVRRCTAFDPQDRYPSVGAVRRALQGGRRTGRAIGLLAAAIALVLGGAWLCRPQPQETALTAALRQSLGLQAGMPIPADRLDEVEQLLLCGRQQMDSLQAHARHAEQAHDCYAAETAHGSVCDADLALLAQCTRLRVLVLDYQQISDLSPLAGLPLEYLSLTGNAVSDLSPLAGMDRLQVLDLGENPVHQADVLAGLPGLREVNLEATGIHTVELFRGSAIRSLNVRSTWVRDYTPLEHCPNLTRLVTGSLPEGAAQTLSGLTGLEELRLYSTPGLDLSLLAGFDALRALDVYGSTILHPEALTGLPALSYVNLGETGLRELSVLSGMQAMTVLELRDDPLTDLTPLLDCPWLERLVLSPRHQALAQEQLTGAPFTVEYF